MYRNILIALIIICFYIYVSMTYYRIGKKSGLQNPGIAWMPFSGPIVIIFESAKMHWWPFAMVSIGTLLIYSVSVHSIMTLNLGITGIYGIILLMLLLAFSVQMIIWHARTYDSIGKPGWWILVPVIGTISGYGFVFIGALFSYSLFLIGTTLYIISFISHLVFIGLAAWTD